MSTLGKTVLMATLVDTDEVASTNVDNTALAVLKLMAALGMLGVASRQYTAIVQ